MIPRRLVSVAVALAAVVASRQLGCAMPLKSHNRIHLLLAVVAVASLIALVIFATTEPVIADQDPRAVGASTLVPQSAPYFGKVTDIRISSDPVYQGWATIFVHVQNRSSAGEAIFDVRLEVDPPGFNNTVYPADTDNSWDNVWFSANGTVTLSKTYNFAQTTGAFSRYRLKAEVYNINGKQNNWRSNDRYDDATRQEDFEVSAASYDASVRDLEISRDTVRQGDTATISAEFTNEVRSSSGDGTFDIAFVIDPPGANNTVELEFTGSSRNFTGDQSKVLSRSHRFQHRGVHIIKARIWNPDRSTLFDESETRVDVKTPYAAEVTDIRISPSPVYQGQATIYVVVRNRSSVNGPERGAATFDVRLEVDPPGGNNTVYPADTDNNWDNVQFSANGTVTLSKTYNFAQTTGAFSRYRLKAEVYNINGKQNNWRSNDRYDDATRQEDFEVSAASYDASVRDLEISRDTVRQGDTATISAEFTNEVRSSSGDGTFDIAFVIDPPGANNTVELEFTGSSRNFTGDQSKVLSRSHRFQHRGVHIIKARIWNPDRSTLFDESETRVDVETPYAAEVTDIRISSDPVYQGQATIYVVVRNRSSVNGPERGAATFDVRLEVDPPGLNNTVYPADTDNRWAAVSFSANGSVTLSKTYNFAQTTSGPTSYRVKAEVYGSGGKQNNWPSDYLFVDATRSEEIEVEAPPEPPDMAIELIDSDFLTTGVDTSAVVRFSVRNNGEPYSGEYAVDFYIADVKGGTDNPIGSWEGAALASGEQLSQQLWTSNIFSNLLGSRWLCGEIKHTLGVEDPNEANNGSCMAVYVLPDLTGELDEDLKTVYFENPARVSMTTDEAIFEAVVPEMDDIAVLQIFGAMQDGTDHLSAGEKFDLLTQKLLIANVPLLSLIPIEGPYESLNELKEGLTDVYVYPPDSHYWIFVPENLTSLDVADGVNDRTWGKLSDSSNRRDLYVSLALDIIRRVEVWEKIKDDAMFIGVDFPEGEFLDSTDGLVDGEKWIKAVEHFEKGLDVGELAIELVDYYEAVEQWVEILNGMGLEQSTQIGFLTYVGLAIDGLKFGFQWADVVGAAGAYRAIKIDDAYQTLELLKVMRVQPQQDWDKAIQLAEEQLGLMTSKNGWERFYASIEEHREELLEAYVDLSVSIALTAAGVTASAFGVPALPVIAAGLVVKGTIEVIKETDDFWDNMALATGTAQLYTSLYELDSADISRTTIPEALSHHREVLDYAKFRFYDYLAHAEDNWASEWGIIRNVGDKLREEADYISKMRSSALDDAIALTRVATVDLPMPTATLGSGDRLVLEPIFKSGSGKVLGRHHVEWSSSDPTVVEVSAAGEIRGVSAGEATVKAELLLGFRFEDLVPKAPYTREGALEALLSSGCLSTDSLPYQSGSQYGTVILDPELPFTISDPDCNSPFEAILTSITDTAELTVTVSGTTVNAIRCSPTRLYVGDTVQCSATINSVPPSKLNYAWEAQGGVVTWAADDGSTASATWDTPGTKPLRVVACIGDNASEYIGTPLVTVGPMDTTTDVASGGTCAEATQTIRVADPTPGLFPGWELPDDTITLGESIDLEFAITKTSWVGGPGGMTVSFLDFTLADSGDGSVPYESSQGTVNTLSYSGNNAQISYLDSGGTDTVENSAGNPIRPRHLIVATDNDRWPPSVVFPPERRLRLRVTPKQAGEFRIQYRYWLCNEDRVDDSGQPYCNRAPAQDGPNNSGRDQQGWAVYEFKVAVVEVNTVRPSRPLALSPASLDAAGGVVVASLVTMDGGEPASAPTFSITGPVVGRVASRAGAACAPGRVTGLVDGERCWETSFFLPANAAMTARTHTVTVRSSQFSEVPTALLTLSAARESGPDDPERVLTEEVVSALAPLGDNLLWILHFDNQTQEWLYYDPAATPTGTLPSLVLGRVYWIGVNADQTAMLGGVGRALMAGLNQVVW